MTELEIRIDEITAIKDMVRVVEKDTFSKSEVMLFLLRRKTDLEDTLAKEMEPQ